MTRKPLRTLRAFTAIEISMVITVIAILALIILPLFRDRVEQARRAAAEDELESLAKAMILAHEDTGIFPRIQDLDNGQEYNNPPLRTDMEIPIAAWNRALSPEERSKLSQGPKTWKGPYLSLSRYKFAELGMPPNGGAIHLFPEFFWSGGPTTGFSYMSRRGGPIMDLLPGHSWLNSQSWVDNVEDRILLDPWGSPYLFFGPDKINEEAGIFPVPQESRFGNAAVYSLGPDGMPGAGVPYQGNPDQLMREAGHLGTGDDFARYL